MAANAGVVPPTGPFRKEDKVRKRPEYLSIYRRAEPMYTARLVFYACPGAGPRRLGCTVPKIVGQSVERNRLKRLIREAFRRTRQGLPQGCVIIVNAKRNAAGMGLGDVLGAFLDIAGRLRKADTLP